MWPLNFARLFLYKSCYIWIMGPRRLHSESDYHEILFFNDYIMLDMVKLITYHVSNLHSEKKTNKQTNKEIVGLLSNYDMLYLLSQLTTNETIFPIFFYLPPCWMLMLVTILYTPYHDSWEKASGLYFRPSIVGAAKHKKMALLCSIC